MVAGTTFVSTLTSLPSGTQPLIAVSPSVAFGKACLVIGSNIAAPFHTDPFAPTPSTTSLPISSPLFKVVSD